MTNLNVYVVSRKVMDWDQYDSITVVAKNEREALEIANTDAWGFDNTSEIRKIDLTVSQGLTASFNAG